MHEESNHLFGVLIISDYILSLWSLVRLQRIEASLHTLCIKNITIYAKIDSDEHKNLVPIEDELLEI
jgi:hypothetical protein